MTQKIYETIAVSSFSEKFGSKQSKILFKARKKQKKSFFFFYGQYEKKKNKNKRKKVFEIEVK